MLKKNSPPGAIPVDCQIIMMDSCGTVHFLQMGQGFPHQLPVLENFILHPMYIRRVACDDVTIFRALLLYKIAFILLSFGRKQSREY